MTIQDLIDQFEIQGAYHIKMWDDNIDDDITFAKGEDFECDKYKIDYEILDKKIDYMYAVDGVLNIEVRNRH